MLLCQVCISVNFLLKLSFSEKATKIWSYHPLDLTFTPNFCGLLRKAELYHLGVYRSQNVEETKLAEGVAGFQDFKLRQRTKLNVTMIPTFAVQRKKLLKNVLIMPKMVTNVYQHVTTCRKIFPLKMKEKPLFHRIFQRYFRV